MGTRPDPGVEGAGNQLTNREPTGGGGEPASDAQLSPAAPSRREGSFCLPARAAVIVVLVGVLITVAASWTAWTCNRHNEHSLLEIQTRQATALLGASILSLRDPLATTLQIEIATGGNIQQFTTFVATLVGPHGPFVSAVLWRSNGAVWQPTAVVGVKPLLDLIHRRLSHSSVGQLRANICRDRRAEPASRAGWAMPSPTRRSRASPSTRTSDSGGPCGAGRKGFPLFRPALRHLSRASCETVRIGHVGSPRRPIARYAVMSCGSRSPSGTRASHLLQLPEAPWAERWVGYSPGRSW